MKRVGGVVNKSVSLAARVTPDLRDEVERAAHRDGVRPSQWVRDALEAHLRRTAR
jgi:hypothetical protein